MQLLKEENEERKQQQQQQRYRNKRRRRDEGNDDQDTSSCSAEEEEEVASSSIHQRQHHRPRVIRILVDDPDEEAENCDDTRNEAKKEATVTPGSTTKMAPSFATRVTTAESNLEVPFWQFPSVDSNQNCKSNGDSDVVDANKVTPSKCGNVNIIKTNDTVNCDEDYLAENLGCIDYDVSSTTPKDDLCNSSVLTNAQNPFRLFCVH